MSVNKTPTAGISRKCILSWAESRNPQYCTQPVRIASEWAATNSLHGHEHLTTQWAQGWCPARFRIRGTPFYSLHFLTGGDCPSTWPQHPYVCRWHTNLHYFQIILNAGRCFNANNGALVYVRQSLRCRFRIPACAPKQGTLTYLLHLWTEM